MIFFPIKINIFRQISVKNVIFFTPKTRNLAWVTFVKLNSLIWETNLVLPQEKKKKQKKEYVPSKNDELVRPFEAAVHGCFQTLNFGESFLLKFQTYFIYTLCSFFNPNRHRLEIRAELTFYESILYFFEKTKNEFTNRISNILF